MTAVRFAFFAFVLSLVAPLAAQPALAQTADECVENLGVAESAYFNGAFDQAISLLQPCIDADAFGPNDAQRAYTLLGRTRFVLGESDAAETAITELFLLNPLYEPDSQFPPNFIAFIDEVKQGMIASGTFPSEDPQIEEPAITPEEPLITDNDPEIQPVKKNRKNLLLFGGGAIAVAGVTAAILAGGGSKDPPATSGWPLPPGRP